MAQLRDAHTSELVAEGSPLELVLVARELDRRAIVPKPGEDLPDGVELLYDGVGLGFDPDAALEDHDTNVARLEEIAEHHGKTFTAEDRKLARRSLDDEQAARERAAAAAADVDAVVESARDADRATLDPVTVTPPA